MQPERHSSSSEQVASILAIDAIVLGQETLRANLMKRFSEAFRGSPAVPFVSILGVEQTIHVCEIGPATRFTFWCWQREVRKLFASRHVA
jgi:hypothetical protein